MRKAEKLLRDLIALPSVNPAFLPERDARAGEQRVSDFLQLAARRHGLEVEQQTVLPGRHNLLVRLTPPGRVQRRILLAPHLDTVGHAEMPQQLFEPRLKDGRLFGRGACDTKGSVAAMFVALCSLTAHRQRPAHTEIIFAGLVDEEHAQAGSRIFAASEVKSDLAIVGEPTRLRLFTAHKGDLWLKLQTRGKAAHGARPELGRNAVHAMARVVECLETDYAAQLRRRRHPLLGHPTINVGSIRGGTQPNIVPPACEISADRRTLPGETEAGVLREIRTMLARRGLSGVKVESLKTSSCLPLETDPELPLVRSLMRQVGQRRPLGAHFFCDASVLAQGGIPSVVFGPGDIAQAHTAEEWISVRELERARFLLTEFLKSPA